MEKTYVCPERNYSAWVDDFSKFTSFSNSPGIFRKWAAIATVGGALQRKVYLNVQGRKLYCNFYTILVGPPGVGKTQAIYPGRVLLESLGETFSLAPESVTKEKLVNILSKSTRVFANSPSGFPISQSAVTGFIGELATFIKPRDFEFMTTLTSLYDSPDKFVSATLSRDEEIVRNTFFSFIGCTTPKAIGENFGPGAFGLGFTSRVNFIYSAAYAPPQVFATRVIPDYAGFREDLEFIHSLEGEMKFAPEAEVVLQSWIDDGMKPVPTHPRLDEYHPRRWLSVLKLAMVYAVGESDSLVISESHLSSAFATLFESELVMENCFSFIGNSSSAEPIRNAIAWIKLEFEKTGTAISESQLKRVLLVDIEPQHVNQTLLEIIASGYVSVTYDSSGKRFSPLD